MTTLDTFFVVNNYVGYKKVDPADVPKNFDRAKAVIEETENGTEFLARIDETNDVYKLTTSKTTKMFFANTDSAVDMAKNPISSDFINLLFEEIGGSFVYKTRDSDKYILATKNGFVSVNLIPPNDTRNAVLYYVSEYADMSQERSEDITKSFPDVLKEFGDANKEVWYKVQNKKFTGGVRVDDIKHLVPSDIKLIERAKRSMPMEERILAAFDKDIESITEITKLEETKKGSVRSLTRTEEEKIKQIVNEPLVLTKPAKGQYTEETMIFSGYDVVRNNVTYGEFKSFMTPGAYTGDSIIDAYGALVMQRSMLYPKLPKCLVLHSNFFEVTDDAYVDSVVRYLADVNYVIAPVNGPVDLSKVKPEDLYKGTARYHWFTVWFRKVNFTSPLTFVPYLYDSSESHVKSHPTDGQEAKLVKKITDRIKAAGKKTPPPPVIEFGSMLTFPGPKQVPASQTCGVFTCAAMDAIALTPVADNFSFKVNNKNVEDMRKLVAAEILNGYIYRPVPKQAAE